MAGLKPAKGNFSKDIAKRKCLYFIVTKI